VISRSIPKLLRDGSALGGRSATALGCDLLDVESSSEVFPASVGRYSLASRLISGVEDGMKRCRCGCNGILAE
jgi:hypothetical protein